MLEKQFLSTTAGNWLGDSDNYVFSNVGEQWIRKKARDVNVGEQILYHKSYVKTSIEEVEPFLERSPRYAFARDELHEKNKNGEYIPQLRTLLIRGLNEENNSPALEDMVLKQNGDFSGKEYCRMAEKVIETIASCGFDPPTGSTVKNWLQGKTVTPMRPKNWAYFSALKSINKAFSDFDPNKREEGSKFYCDYLYTTVRQGIMRYLADCKNKGKGPKSKTDNADGDKNGEGYRLSLEPEIQSTMDFFLKDISEDFVAARVTSSSMVKRLGIMRHIEKNNPGINLSKGIVTEKPEIRQISEISAKELIEGEQLLEECVWKTIIDYSKKKFFLKYDALNLKEDDFAETRCNLHERFRYMLRNKLIEKFDKELKFNEYLNVLSEMRNKSLRNYGLNELAELSNVIGKTEEELADSIASETYEDMFKGKLDSHYNLTKGASVDLVEAFIKIKKAIPKIIYQRDNLADEVFNLLGNSEGFSRQSRAELFKRIKRSHESLCGLEEEIAKEYPDLNNSKVVLGTAVRSFKNLRLKARKDVKNYLKSEREIIREKDFQLFLDGKYEEIFAPQTGDSQTHLGQLLTSTGKINQSITKEDLMKRTEAHEILKGYNLECLMPMIEYNFAFENAPTFKDRMGQYFKKIFKK
jgi:hypothetical protein